MADLSVTVTTRDETGKNESRRLRRQGLIPAILYGEKKDPVALAIESRVVHQILHSRMGVNTVFELAMKGTDRKRAAMIKDFQLDPVTDRLVHADFIRIDASHEVHVPVHVELQGIAVGVKVEGGILEFTTRELLVACLPKDIPASVPIDVSGLHIGDVIRLSDLELPEGVRVLTDRTAVICAVHQPKQEAVATPVAGAVVVEGAAAAAAPDAAAKAGAGAKPGAPGKAAAPAKAAPAKAAPAKSDGKPKGKG